MKIFSILALAGLALIGGLHAADDALSAADLAARLREEPGSSYVRLKMEVQEPPGTKKEAFQIQIKKRISQGGTDIVYQILWPKERQGEALLLHQESGRPGGGFSLTAGGKLQAMDSSQMSQPLFGSDLALADVMEDFFAWSDQKIVGTEIVDKVSCQILESKPGGDSSIYGLVRSWVDPRRMVPLRVEKYWPSGKLARRIETTRVVAQGYHRNVPANLTVHKQGGNSATELDGSRLQRSVTFSDQEFTSEGLKDTKAPH